MILYFLIAFFATTIGAIAGIGGGLIIKPLLSVSTTINIENITIISSITILAMASTTIIKKRHERKNLIPNFSFIVIGSLAGGILGNQSFIFFKNAINNNALTTIIQSIILIILLIFILITRYLIKNYSIQKHISPSKFNLVLLGIFLGSISAFLGIGGGLVNVAFLTILFSLDMKLATFTSIFIIFFSQLSNVTTYILSGVIFANNITPIFATIPAAILGGIFGNFINKKIQNSHVNIIYNCLMLFLIFLNTYTIIIFLAK